MKTMKVIDLLNKIANGESTPKRFKIGFINYDFINGNAKLDYELFSSLLDEDYNLNTEVEIIEDTPKENKKIEHLKLHAPYPECTDDRFDDVEDKINEIIKVINGE